MEPNYPAMDPNVSHPHASTVSLAVIEPLRRTKGWARFLSVLGFIGSGLMILGGLLLIVMGASGGLMSGSKSALLAGAPLGMMGVIYIVVSLVYLVPSFWLGRYATRIGELTQRQSELDLIAALEAQRSFWKFLGVFTLVVMSIYALIFVVAIIAAIAGAASM